MQFSMQMSNVDSVFETFAYSKSHKVATTQANVRKTPGMQIGSVLLYRMF